VVAEALTTVTFGPDYNKLLADPAFPASTSAYQPEDDAWHHSYFTTPPPLHLRLQLIADHQAYATLAQCTRTSSCCEVLRVVCVVCVLCVVCVCRIEWACVVCVS
jgi:hypothetical protein